MTRPARIVSLALEYEAEGLTADEAFERACAQVSVAPASARLARTIWDAQTRRAGRVEVVLPDRDQHGRFVEAPR